MKVSFCMPAFNKELYLNDAITSILGQDYKDIELVIVDDASTDGTRDICEYYVAEYPEKIRYFRNNKNMGVGYCRNKAWSHAKGDIICVNDADDLSLIYRAKKTVETFKKTNADILYGSCMAVNHKNENVGYRAAEEFHVSRIKKENFIYHPTVAYKYNIPVKYRNIRFIDDWYFYLDCVNKGLKFGYVIDIIGVYRLIHDGLTQDGGFYHLEKEKAKKRLKEEFKDFQEDISEKLRTDPGQKERVKAILREIPSKSKVLDMGCNGGYIMQKLLKKCSNVEGIEISNYLVKRCKAKGLKVKQADLLTFKTKKKYDVILLCDILEHFEMIDVLKIIDNATKCLTKKGRLVITVPYRLGRHSKKHNPDHVRDYDFNDFKIINTYKWKSNIILEGENAIPDWSIITGDRCA